MNNRLSVTGLGLLMFIFLFGTTSCASIKARKAEKAEKKEVEAGIRESWEVGLEEVKKQAGNADSLRNDSNGLRLAWPEEAKKALETVRKTSLKKWVDSLEAQSVDIISKLTVAGVPVLREEIKKIKVEDPMGILFGGPTAGTDYLRSRTEPQLKAALLPIAEQATANTKANLYWNTAIKYYNKIPLVKNVDISLSEFLTDRAIDGMFYYMASSEKKLRKDPTFRASKLLYKIYSKQDNREAPKK